MFPILLFTIVFGACIKLALLLKIKDPVPKTVSALVTFKVTPEDTVMVTPELIVQEQAFISAVIGKALANVTFFVASGRPFDHVPL
ncbi:hypothetical protein FLA105534_01517 [Flavobacterium bizetiae]|uniref:Uncharacterized protein n=1 Tax=Flavobacterium bizetiae TaxID=2704140 RepID=A0A6J4GEB4_9FLAO|nr:hypothetical protein FLA105534_01517 [Flavobacterium bizetiae]CAD5342873.1 hypothetical protein FLA105535_02870 [Flavobacterium bizetiae]CAD5349300.1 hypothetical protein FLA105534_03284 [Flavobacterium bizetiae]